MDTIRRIIKQEAFGGILLMFTAMLAIAMVNSPLAPVYGAILDTTVAVQVGAFALSKPLLLWINDGLMAIFFLLVALEIKREFLAGNLSDASKASLPVIAAIGGMVVPALVYYKINMAHPEYLNGWAIPAATDIAFALGVLSLLGKRVPLSVKVLLTAIAVIDDLGAIIIIALFYTSNLSVLALGLALAAMVVLVVMNRAGVTRPMAYGLVGTLLWIFVLKSGVHATLAGVFVGLCIPLTSKKSDHSPLEKLEHELHPWVTFGVLPVFGFANAGVSFAGVSLDAFLEPLTLGIIAGLFVGKQVGIFGFSWLAVMAKIAKKPDDMQWRHLYAMSLLCGIGFTMSLFIGSLAFEDVSLIRPVRFGVIGGSILSGVLGYAILRLTVPAPTKKNQATPVSGAPE